MKSINPYIKTIESAFVDLLSPEELAGLHAPIAYQLSLGGKRLRPALTLMACQMFGAEGAKALDPALGIEIFHNFTLLHDDVMDKADIRRGKTTVHKKWDENTAILAGDAMQILAYQLFCQVEKEHLPAVLTLFSKTALEITKGQQLDLEFESRMDVTQEEYLEMIRLKTAVLLGCSLQMGAIVAGASAGDAQSLYDFGQYIGLAFQLQDDLLDVYGDAATFGKEIGGDIMNNKKTYLLIQALQETQGEIRQELQQWIGATNAPREAKVAAVTAIYNSVEIRKHCEEKMQYFYNKAIDSILQIKLADELRQPLIELAQQLMNRNY